MAQRGAYYTQYVFFYFFSLLFTETHGKRWQRNWMLLWLVSCDKTTLCDLSQMANHTPFCCSHCHIISYRYSILFPFSGHFGAILTHLHIIGKIGGEGYREVAWWWAGGVAAGFLYVRYSASVKNIFSGVKQLFQLLYTKQLCVYLVIQRELNVDLEWLFFSFVLLKWKFEKKNIRE